MIAAARLLYVPCIETPHDRLTRRNPGLWTFYVRRYGLAHVVVDANGEPIASSVPAGCGPLLAAGPELLAALARVAQLTPAGSPAHEVAVDAFERFGEGEGIALADWKPATGRRVAPRIVGVAS